MAKLSTASKTIEREDGTRVELRTAIDRTRRIDTAYDEIYLGLYQAITGPEDRDRLYREFSPVSSRCDERGSSLSGSNQDVPIVVETFVPVSWAFGAARSRDDLDRGRNRDWLA